MSKYKGNPMTTEEIMELEALESEVQKSHIDGAVPTAKAWLTIREKAYWRLTDPSWEKYMRRRWGYTLKGMTYVLIRAAAIDKMAIGHQALPQTVNQDADFAAAALAEALSKGADVASFNVDSAVSLLREARQIVVSRIMVENEGRVDFIGWLERLKALATDLLALKDDTHHADRSNDRTGTDDSDGDHPGQPDDSDDSGGN